MPFSIQDRTATPISLYAATKKSGEMLCHAYSHLYHIPMTGLRLFTVYGPWGRPDMAYFLFTKAMLGGTPIRLFNQGDMRRDFTYIDDIVNGILASLERPPSGKSGQAAHVLYNLGNHLPVPLIDVISVLEQTLGKKAILHKEPLPPGDVPETFADIAESRRDLGFDPGVTIQEGLPKFVAWYRAYYKV